MKKIALNKIFCGVMALVVPFYVYGELVYISGDRSFSYGQNRSVLMRGGQYVQTEDATGKVVEGLLAEGNNPRLYYNSNSSLRFRAGSLAKFGPNGIVQGFLEQSAAHPSVRYSSSGSVDVSSGSLVSFSGGYLADGYLEEGSYVTLPYGPGRSTRVLGTSHVTFQGGYLQSAYMNNSGSWVNLSYGNNRSARFFPESYVEFQNGYVSRGYLKETVSKNIFYGNGLSVRLEPESLAWFSDGFLARGFLNEDYTPQLYYGESNYTYALPGSIVDFKDGYVSQLFPDPTRAPIYYEVFGGTIIQPVIASVANVNAWIDTNSSVINPLIQAHTAVQAFVPNVISVGPQDYEEWAWNMASLSEFGDTLAPYSVEELGPYQVSVAREMWSDGENFTVVVEITDNDPNLPLVFRLDREDSDELASLLDSYGWQLGVLDDRVTVGKVLELTGHRLTRDKDPDIQAKIEDVRQAFQNYANYVSQIAYNVTYDHPVMTFESGFDNKGYVTSVELGATANLRTQSGRLVNFSAGDVVTFSDGLVVDGVPGRPYFIEHPSLSSDSIEAGDDVEISAFAASSNGSVSYRWYRNNAVIPGQTGSTLSLNSVTGNDEGSYYVRATNASGSTNSLSITLRVGGPLEIVNETFSSGDVYIVNHEEIIVRNNVIAQSGSLLELEADKITISPYTRFRDGSDVVLKSTP